MRVGELIEMLHKFGMNDEVLVPASRAEIGKLTDHVGYKAILNNYKRYVCILPTEGDWSGKIWEFKDEK